MNGYFGMSPRPSRSHPRSCSARAVPTDGTRASGDRSPRSKCLLEGLVQEHARAKAHLAISNTQAVSSMSVLAPSRILRAARREILLKVGLSQNFNLFCTPGP